MTARQARRPYIALLAVHFANLALQLAAFAYSCLSRGGQLPAPVEHSMAAGIAQAMAAAPFYRPLLLAVSLAGLAAGAALAACQYRMARLCAAQGAPLAGLARRHRDFFAAAAILVGLSALLFCNHWLLPLAGLAELPGLGLLNLVVVAMSGWWMTGCSRAIEQQTKELAPAGAVW